MSVFWLLAMMLATAQESGAAANAPAAPRSSLCGTGSPRDLINVRVFPISIIRRVHPSAEEIIEHGGDVSMVRAFWTQAMPDLCRGKTIPMARTSNHFEPRIIVFVEGERAIEPMLLEYPDWKDKPAPVRAKLDGQMMLVPAAVVRKLLDYSRAGWRD